MSRKLKKIVLENPPLTGNDVESLRQNFQEAFGAPISIDSLVMFFVQHPSRIVFAKLNAKGKIESSAKTVSFELPCPPYCGTRDYGQLIDIDINVLTTT